MSPQPNASGRGTLRRIFGAQESGLVLVIALMMAGLWYFGGTKQLAQVRDVGADAEVTVTDAGYVVADGGGERTYPRPAWRLVEAGSGSRTLVGPRVERNKFLDNTNLMLVATNASFIAVIAVGMTGVIILAGIDLSVGSVYGLSAVVGAMVLTGMPGSDAAVASGGGTGWSWLSIPVGLAVCVGVGALCGFANGAMTVGFRVHPFVITLGMMAGLRGLMIVMTDAQSISGFPDAFTRGFFKLGVGGIHPVLTLIMFGVAAAGVFVLNATVFGRQVFAIGGNETAARYAGISVGRVKILVYTIAGALAGLSGCMYIGWYGAAEPNAGMAYELKVIAAAVIGGASLMGGRGTALGAILGAIIIELINNGMIILGIEQNYNQIVMGAAIIIAVVVDQSKSRFGRGRTA